MLTFLGYLFATAGSALKSRRDLAVENLALRQQLAILERERRRPRLTDGDRIFWVWLSKLWTDWADALLIVKPETVIRWHRKGFKWYWTQKSKRRGPGRPKIDPDVRALVRWLWKANPTWGAPRIHGELLKLGIEVSQRIVGRLMPKRLKPPSQTWRTFLDKHVKDLVSIDFFVVPTATFRVLFVLLILAHERRRVVHFNVTDHPHAEWTALQVVQAFPWDTAPRYMIRDRDGVFGARFRGRVEQLGIEEVITAPRSPWQDPFCERMIGSVRRECLDHVIVLGETHLRRILKSYFDYYHCSRTHLSLDKDAPDPREVQSPELGEVIEFPQVGGLHHRYERRAA
jgi:transposase InsO family protein